jgi:hypothetical protein
MALVDMAMSPEEAKEEYGCGCAPTSLNSDDPSAPKYPYGLELSLNEESLQKLGLTQLPAVGTKMRITAECTVSRTSAYQSQGGEPEQNVSLQITSMDVGTTEGGDDQEPDIAELLYGGGNSMGSAPSGV